MPINRAYYILLFLCALMPAEVALYLTIPGLRALALWPAISTLLKLNGLFCIPVALTVMTLAVAQPVAWLQFVAGVSAIALDTTIGISIINILVTYPLQSEYVQFGAGIVYFGWVLLLGGLLAGTMAIAALVVGVRNER